MESLLAFAMAIVDSIMAVIPRATPSKEALQHCKIISHRGEHDNVTVMENTLEAFSAARKAGVWGIECDIRWTADLVPVICHDPGPLRVFGIEKVVRELSFAELRSVAPLIPSLSEVIAEFGGNTHLMLEIKAEIWPDPSRQEDSLRSLLAPLIAVTHYHILALDPTLFTRVSFLPSQCFLPVSEINVRSLSRIALTQGFAGLGGHYLLLGNRLKERHAALDQRLGIGFPRSRNSLYRELNRGIEWVFSNDAVALQKIRNDQLSELEK
ncbi:MAG: glycerophosphoryl diester phosphodiesterase [Halioglobus sp.]|jgi:glycerophosphoryl diester phosphodiesterase